MLDINPLREHQERITKEDKKLVKDIDYDEIDFPIQDNAFDKIEKKTFALMYFITKICYS